MGRSKDQLRQSAVCVDRAADEPDHSRWASKAWLVVTTVYAISRRRRPELLVLLWMSFGVLFVGTCAVALVDYTESGKITKCRAPLVGDSTCTGLNDSWIECRWAFRAEGRPEPALCERFLQLPPGYRGHGETADYDDVGSFSEVPCSDWRVPVGDRCFVGFRHEHEATNRYLMAFDPSCSASVVLRSCNEELEAAKRFAPDASQ